MKHLTTWLCIFVLAGCSTAGKELRVEEELDENQQVVKRTTTGPAGWVTMMNASTAALGELSAPECTEQMTEVEAVACNMARMAFYLSLGNIKLPQEAIGDTIARETQSQNSAIGTSVRTAGAVAFGVVIGEALEAGFDAARGDNTTVNNTLSVDDEGSFTGDFASTGVGSNALGGATQSIGSAQGGSALDTNDTLTQPAIDGSGGDGDAAGPAAPITVNPTDVDNDTSLF